MRYTFSCAEHEEFGNLGWRLMSQPDFDPLSGMAVAHDILEHFPNGDGSPKDELLALGASIWVRDGWHTNGTAGDNIAPDLQEVLRHVTYEDMSLPDPPATKPLEHYAEDEITKAVECLLRESKYNGEKYSPSTLSAVRGWLRIGYRKGVRRYNGWYACDVQTIFNEIMQAADKALKHAEAGDRLVVSYAIQLRKHNYQLKVRHIPGYELGEEY
jgi:hypothetical protein